MLYCAKRVWQSCCLHIEDKKKRSRWQQLDRYSQQRLFQFFKSLAASKWHTRPKNYEDAFVGGVSTIDSVRMQVGDKFLEAWTLIDLLGEAEIGH